MKIISVFNRERLLIENDSNFPVGLEIFLKIKLFKNAQIFKSQLKLQRQINRTKATMMFREKLKTLVAIKFIKCFINNVNVDVVGTNKSK